MSEKVSQRQPSMDIIRCLALFFVVSVHFFLHNGYYDWTVDGLRMYIMTAMRSFLIICVPLFIVLSGYLTCTKTISRSYYTKIIYTISIYVLSSVCCVVYKVFFLDDPISIWKVIQGFFDFTNAPYAWYVEMYLGLFLLTPLLNTLYNNLKNKKEKQILLGTLLLLTSLPHIVNIYIPNLAWFADPASSYEYVKILPTYWTCLYPITYYYIGCYIREFKLNISTGKNLLLSLLVFIVNGTFNYYRSHGTVFVGGVWQEYGSLLIVAQTVLFFAFFDNLDYKNFPIGASRFFSRISGLCFGGYLLSWIFDTAFYEILNESVPIMPLRLNYFPIIVPCVYICSLFLSFLINNLYTCVSGWILRIFRHSKTKV